MVGSFSVILGNQDIGSEFTASQMDALIRMLNVRADIQAMSELIKWSDLTIIRPLIFLNEKHRWDAIVDGSVERKGDNGLIETVTYPNPAGHRVNVVGAWSDPTHDIWGDILALVQVMTDKGYTVNRFITSRKVVGFMSKNDDIIKRTGRLVILGSVSETLSGRVSITDINQALSNDGLPPIETYDLRYQTATGGGRFLKDTVFVMVCSTGRDETIDLGPDQGQRIIPDTLGYFAVGRPAGQTEQGRVLKINPRLENKPPHIEGEGWQTSLPVITEPEAIGVLAAIA
jgi:hypothetical protein